MLEIVDDAFSVEKVHAGAEKIPVQRSGEGKVFGSAGDICYSYDFLERDDLNSGDYGEDVDMPGEHGCEEAGDHDEGPYRASDEGLLLLLVFRLRFWFFL